MRKSFSKYIESLMRDKANRPHDNMLKAALYLFSFIYRFIIFIWDLFYKAGIFRVYKVSCRVVSIGNITVGGTGKTPLTVLLAKTLKEKGKKVCILTRGYGDDENRMLRNLFGDIAVIVSRDRVKSARKACREISPDIILLDDGYQHRRLHRDINILLIDSINPFGNRQVLPRGILREPLKAVERADCIICTKSNDSAGISGLIKKETEPYFKGNIQLEAGYYPVNITNITSGEKYPVEFLKDKKVSIVSGLADNTSFRSMVKRAGADIRLVFDYPDHNSYSATDISKIKTDSNDAGCDIIITTAKDEVKLNKLSATDNRDNIYSFDIEIRIEKGMEKLLAEIN